MKKNKKFQFFCKLLNKYLLLLLIMGVIASCISHCFSIFIKKKVKEENDTLSIPLVEIKRISHEKENIKIEISKDSSNKKKSLKQSLRPSIQRFSLNEKPPNEDDNIVFYTPKNSLRNKNVKFSLKVHEINDRSQKFQEMLFEKRTSHSQTKSIGSSKSLDFYSCKESESNKESLVFVDTMHYEANMSFLFDVKKLKKLNIYNNFLQDLDDENLEILEISFEITNYLLSELEKTHSFLLKEISNFPNQNSMIPIFDDPTYEARFFLGSELTLNSTRSFTLNGEFVINAIQEDFLYFINKEDVIRCFFNFKDQFLLAKKENILIYFTNIRDLYGNLGCNFFFCKKCFHQNENLCEISFSIANEQMLKEMKEDKIFNEYKNFEFGSIFSEIIISKNENNNNTNFSETKSKIKICIKLNYMQNLPLSLAKYMFTNQVKSLFERIKRVFK